MPVDPPDPQPIDMPHLSGKLTNTSGQPVSTASMYFIKKNGLEGFLKRADSGDLEAALKLSKYYSFSELNERKGDYWLKRCAELGHIISQYNYAVKLMGENKKEGALVWATKAAESGYASAKSLIQEVERK